MITLKGSSSGLSWAAPSFFGDNVGTMTFFAVKEGRPGPFFRFFSLPAISSDPDARRFPFLAASEKTGLD